MDHTHNTMVLSKKHNTMVYIKYGHVSSNVSLFAAGTARALRRA